jgi:AcrR family transcriptional regulator
VSETAVRRDPAHLAAPTAVDGSPLSPKQLARRQRVIEVTLQLGADGGYDAVHMREVADRSQVSLGTIYRYFGSKDHLLAAALSEWTAQLQSRLARRPARGESAVEQLVDVLRRGSRALEQQPNLAAALIRALGSDDPMVGLAATHVRSQISAMAAPILAALGPVEIEEIVGVLRHVWYSAMMIWANGRSEVSAIGDDLERAARLLLAAHPALCTPNPSSATGS